VITETEIDRAIAILENPAASSLSKWHARIIVNDYVKQENQTLEWLNDCYRCCRHHAVGPA
jgi:hypothetical protein